MISSFVKIWNFSKKRHKNFVESIVFSFLQGIFRMIQMWAIIVTIYVLIDEKSFDKGLKSVVILMLVCILGTFLTSYVSQIAIMKTGMFMTADKRMQLGKILRNTNLGFFNNSSAGRIGSVLTTTLSDVEMAAPVSLIIVIGGFLGSISILIAMLIFEWHIGIITLVGMVTYLFAVDWQVKISRRNAPKRQQAQDNLSVAVVSFLQGIKVIKSFSAKEGDTCLKTAIEESRNENIHLTDKSMFSQVATQLCIAVFEILTIVVTVYLYYGVQAISLATAIVLIVISFMIYASINQAGSILSMVGMLDSAMKDVNELESIEQMECKEPIEKMNSDEIVFDNVCFSYGEREVIHNISTTIKPQSLTAIIGPSGSGKSTICKLVPRFWDVTSGSIRIGGADIRHVENSELMNKISIVFQDTYLFEDTILNNIRFGKPDATLQEVREAARAARCDEFIMSLPEKYETLVKEGGSSLSGGEKQRISIARAILKNAQIIILDEATSALDSKNERDILEAIDELTKNKTVIMIAHRMKTVRNADHIIAIEHGRIVQEGNHDELIMQDGIYSRFLKERTEAMNWKIR